MQRSLRQTQHLCVCDNHSVMAAICQTTLSCSLARSFTRHRVMVMTRMSRFLPAVATATVTVLALIVLVVPPIAATGTGSQVGARSSPLVERFAMVASGPVLEAPSRAGRFIAAIGAGAAALGYEHRPLELWAWPLKIADDFDVAFSLENYPAPLEGRDLLARVSVRPESTTLIYTHAAFTVRQILFVPPDESAIVALFDVKSVLPVQVIVRFRPRLRLMWPATSMTPFVAWNAAMHVYDIGEESGKLAAVIAAPGARDLGVLPYQEEPRDVPVTFAFDPARYDASRDLPAVVVTA